MVICPTCQQPNPEKASICSRCGGSLELSTGKEIAAAPVPSPLEGLDDVLPLEPSISLPHRTLPLTAPIAAMDGVQAAGLFQQIASEGAAPQASQEQPAQAVTGREQAPAKGHHGRLLLYLLVLLAALLPLFTGGLTASWVRPRATVQALEQDLSALPAGSAVLLSFDYTPAYAGEMNTLALTLVRQLASQGVRVLAMSTKPGGIGLAEQTLELVATEKPAWRYSQDYVLLGYLPWQEISLRLLNSSLAGAFKRDHIESRPLIDLPAMKGLVSVKDMQCVVVLADDSDAVRRWIEQVQSQSKMPLDALVAAEVEPMLVPYRQSGQLRHLLGIANEAAEYEVAGQTRPTALKLTDSYAAFFVLLLFVAFSANTADLWARRTRRRKQR
jgi:hypothetical protein